MTPIAVIIGLLLTFYVMRSLIRPFTAGSAEEAQAAEIFSFDRFERQRLVQVLRDLEIDFQTGKIPQEDYHNLKLASSRELAEVLSRLDKAAHERE